ncbi:hypothetical protein MTO96_018359 [Rhipicephalus appendiculatus]
MLLFQALLSCLLPCLNLASTSNASMDGPMDLLTPAAADLPVQPSLFDFTSLVKQPWSYSDASIGMCTAANAYIRPPRPTSLGHGTAAKTAHLPMLLFQALLSCLLPCLNLASTSNASMDGPMDLLTPAAADLPVQPSLFDFTSLVKQPWSYSDASIGMCTAANAYIRPPRPTSLGHGTAAKTAHLPMLLFQALLSCLLPCLNLASTSNASIDGPMDLLTPAVADLPVQPSLFEFTSLVKQPWSYSDASIGMCTAANAYKRPPRPASLGHGTAAKTAHLPMLLFQALLSCLLPCLNLASTSNASMDGPMDLLTPAAADLPVQPSLFDFTSLVKQPHGRTVTRPLACAPRTHINAHRDQLPLGTAPQRKRRTYLCCSSRRCSPVSCPA